MIDRVPRFVRVIVGMFLLLLLAIGVANHEPYQKVMNEVAQDLSQSAKPQFKQRSATICTAADFEIIGFTPRIVDDCRVTPCPALKLTGKLKNNCTSPAGAQIKITAEDGKRNVIDTIDGWPASTRNIGPSQEYAFDLGPLMRYRPGMKLFHAQVIDARIWR